MQPAPLLSAFESIRRVSVLSITLASAIVKEAIRAVTTSYGYSTRADHLKYLGNKRTRKEIWLPLININRILHKKKAQPSLIPPEPSASGCFNMKISPILLALAASVASTEAYKIVDADSLHCRSGPGTNYAVVRTLDKSIDITIQCQEPGTNVKGDSLWVKTQFGCYVADFYVQTGTSDYIAPRCGGGGGGGGGSSPCSDLNAAGIDLIKHFEGFVHSLAPDPIGIPTVGYGHLSKSKNCAEVPFKFPLSPATATELLQKDIPGYTSCLARSLNGGVSLNQNQWAALVSWTFNVGCGNVKTSSLVRRLNQGQDPNIVAPQELPAWNKAGGRVMAGLTRRRKAEVDLFKAPFSQKAYPKCA